MCINFQKNQLILHSGQWDVQRTSSVLSLLWSQMDVLPTPVRRTKWCQICPSQYERQKDFTEREMHLQTDAFWTSTGRPLRSYMDFILFILWKYSGKLLDLCDFSNEQLEVFISYIKQRKLGIQLDL